MLNEHEKNKYDIISKLMEKEITKKEAMEKLNLTERHIYRLKKNIYRKRNRWLHS